MFKTNNSSQIPSLGARDRNWEFMLHNSIKIFSELAFPLKRESEASNSKMQCWNVEQKTFFFHFGHKF